MKQNEAVKSQLQLLKEETNKIDKAVLDEKYDNLVRTNQKRQYMPEYNEVTIYEKIGCAIAVSWCVGWAYLCFWYEVG